MAENPEIAPIHSAGRAAARQMSALPMFHIGTGLDALSDL
jgi:hypothetical protein